MVNVENLISAIELEFQFEQTQSERRINLGKLLGRAITEPVARGISAAKFPVWKTITLGTEKSPKGYREAMEKAGFRIGDWASQILNKVTVASESTELDLVVVTVRELGFTEGTRRDAIYEKALSLGLQLCPNEVGPALRLQYADQPLNEWMVIGMEPLTGSFGDLLIFSVDHGGGGRWLDSHYGEPDHVWCPDYRWVFVLPASSPRTL